MADEWHQVRVDYRIVQNNNNNNNNSVSHLNYNSIEHGFVLGDCWVFVSKSLFISVSKLNALVPPRLGQRPTFAVAAHALLGPISSIPIRGYISQPGCSFDSNPWICRSSQASLAYNLLLSVISGFITPLQHVSGDRRHLSREAHYLLEQTTRTVASREESESSQLPDPKSLPIRDRQALMRREALPTLHN